MNNREKVLWSGSLYVLGIRKGSENMSRSRREPRDGGIVREKPVKIWQQEDVHLAWLPREPTVRMIRCHRGDERGPGVRDRWVRLRGGAPGR